MAINPVTIRAPSIPETKGLAARVDACSIGQFPQARPCPSIRAQVVESEVPGLVRMSMTGPIRSANALVPTEILPHHVVTLLTIADHINE